jgi:hypothetical protein
MKKSSVLTLILMTPKGIPSCTQVTEAYSATVGQSSLNPLQVKTDTRKQRSGGGTSALPPFR